MEIIISIAAVLLLVSLYDYFSSRNWQQVTSSSRNDVVFDKRNKKYGAYEIRRNYDKTLIMVILGVVTTIGMSYGAYLLTKDVVEDEIIASDGLQVEIDLPPVEIDVVIDKPVVEKIDKTEQLAKEIDFSKFEITDDPTSTRINTQDDIDNEVKIGNQNIDDGKEPDFKEPLDKTVKTIQLTTPDVETWVDEEAEFPGGYAAMMKYFSKNMKYPEIPLQAGIEGKANLRFVVEKDGSIGSVEVQKGVANCLECDKEAMRVIKSMPKWKPGRKNGNIVRSYYTMPVAFKIKG